MANGAGGRREGAGRSPGKRRDWKYSGVARSGVCWPRLEALVGGARMCSRMLPARQRNSRRALPDIGPTSLAENVYHKGAQKPGLAGKATISIRSRYEHSCSN